MNAEKKNLSESRDSQRNAILGRILKDNCCKQRPEESNRTNHANIRKRGQGCDSGTARPFAQHVGGAGSSPSPANIYLHPQV